MATLVLAAGDNSHADTNLKITGNLSAPATVFMDDIGADSGQVDAGSIIPILNTGTAAVTVKDKYGHMVGKVPAKSNAYARAGNDEVWRLLPEARVWEDGTDLDDATVGLATPA